MKTLFISCAGKNKKYFRKISVTPFLMMAAGLMAGTAYGQQPAEQDTLVPADYKLDEVLVQGVRASAQTPVTFSNITKEELAPRNLGQDVPILLNYLPSVVTTTDAGNGFGYTYIRVRGADASRINVTLNGVPYNDAESQGTFWVNMGDIASSVENIQLQRGVGTSTNGAGAFGASLNLLTDAYSKEANAEISNSYGSFNSRKHTVKFSTGLINDHFEVAGRLSNIASDGYIDRASVDLKSYFLQGTYVGKTTLVKALVFGGTEVTYQAWNGIDAETLRTNRRFNSSGIYTDEAGNIKYYDDETDNYKQDHFQLHWNERLSGNWNTNLALHYTIGKGYYENYRDDTPVAGYPGIIATGMVDYYGETLPGTDLITRKWLDNDFYGTTFSANYTDTALNFTFGGAWNKYEGDHFGNIIWAQNSGSVRPDDRYYDNDAVKTDFNIYAKANYKLLDNLSLFGDMQYRRVNYEASNVLEETAEPVPVDDTFNFYNPKAGLTFTVNDKNSLYFSYARGNKEPRRTDYESGSTKPESLNDFELGWRFRSGRNMLNVNGYYMRYKDQLVLTGELNDVGAAVYTNSGDSYRAGLEIDATLYITDRIVLRPNIALSANKNLDFYTEGEAGPQSVGDTEIAFSPNVIAGNQLIVVPVKDLQVALLSKFVGEQYMDNLESDNARLESYYVSDLNISYELKMDSFVKSIVFSGLVNNIFDVEYVSNGAMYGDPYYFPQAGINFLAGATIKF
ncbi:TonB-dependent receptor [Flavobacterium sp. MK4S-17]|uniref:TonB-dependent receptor n=1 Tax=Flavobacterium sp. MK4S-17 TaxID=2543737 RepID=UPI0013589518|nr:TonB-dependent receptor [Flavobacterium sp. MK4S-17]